MKFTIEWLKDHLDTKLNDEKIIDKLTNVGLEVESFQSQPSELDHFLVAKIISSEKHPNADRLKVCEVDIGKKENIKVVCGAPNAKQNLITVEDCIEGQLVPLVGILTGMKWAKDNLKDCKKRIKKMFCTNNFI